MKRRSLLVLGLAFLLCPFLYSQTVNRVQGLPAPVTQDAILYFQAIPQNTNGSGNIDALFALSEGPFTAYSDCSAILRFNNMQTSPYLDVYSNGYTRTNNVEINFGDVYHCWFEIHFDEKTYSTYVQVGETDPVLIHENASFRKSGVSGLFYWNSVYYGPSSTNALSVQNTGFVNAVGEFAPDWLLFKSAFGLLDNATLTITDIPPMRISDFADGLSYAGSAELELVDGSGGSVSLSSDETLMSDMTLRVIGIETSEYDLEVRSVSDENNVLSAFSAEIKHETPQITKLYNNLTLQQFKSGIRVSPFATFEVLDTSKDTIATDPTEVISAIHAVEVTAENGDSKTYTIATGSEAMSVETVGDSTNTFGALLYQNLQLDGAVEWYVKDAENPLPGSFINITSEDVWIYFNHIRPQKFYDNFLNQFRINGELPEVDVNVRLVAHGEGCVLISHPNTYTPLTVYADTELSGDSKDLDIYTFHKNTSLSTLDDNIESFVLKKGYMASFSENQDGTGSSQVFIADEEDLIFNTMPEGLSNNVSFIRVVPWRWVSKKSFADGNYEKNEILNSTWRYNWDNTAESSLNIEYVPMRHNPNWNSYSNIVNKKNVTHALHFNEPDNPVDDGYATVETAIAQWPEMLKSGLRLGTPAPTDGGAQWVIDFVNACKANNYRVDFVAIHFYRGGQSVNAFYDFLNYIHTQTGLPVWVTEWNNGANWTCCLPTYEEQAETISDWVDMLEAAPFVERYALYGKVQAERQMFYDGTLSPTPAGRVYRDKSSGLAYNSREEHVNNPFPADQAVEIELNTTLYWNPLPGTSAQMLYFGDTYPPEFKAHLGGDQSQFKLEELEFNKSYYWRVDEYNEGTVVSGEDLEFSTIHFKKASNPSPANEEEGVDPGTILSWNSDPGKTQIHSLYLGESMDNMQLEATFLDNITSYNAADLKGNKTYYWRVDELVKWRDGQDILTEGDIWSFSTITITGLDREETLTAYPVPLKNTLFIKGLDKEQQVHIFNILGQKVLSQKTKGEVLVGHLPKGIYIVKIEGFKPLKVTK